MGCPQSTALALGNISCLTDITEVDKILIRRTGQTALATTDLTTKAGLDALLAAADSTKIILSPWLYNSTIEPGGVITDDKKVAGIPVVVGEEASKLNAKMRLTSTVYAQLKELEDETGLEAIFITQAGDIFAKLVAATPTYKGVPFKSIFTTAPRVGGNGTADEHDFEISFASNWYEDLTQILADDLDYDALYDIENA